MAYFVTLAQRKGTCYHEFFRGKWDEETFWREDSIYLDDDVLSENDAFADILDAAVPNWWPYGVTEITRAQWERVGQLAQQAGGHALEMFLEADAWAQPVLAQEGCFTILGV